MSPNSCREPWASSSRIVFIWSISSLRARPTRSVCMKAPAAASRWRARRQAMLIRRRSIPMSATPCWRKWNVKFRMTPNCCGLVSRITAASCANTAMSLPAGCGARTSTASRCRCGRRNIKHSLWSRSVFYPRCMMRSGCTRRSHRGFWNWVPRSAVCLRAQTGISSAIGSRGKRFRYRPITIKSSRRRRRMTWKPELDDLARREAFAREMGGVDKVKRQRDQGRLTVRERIDRLVDSTSFHEIGAISGSAEYDEHGELKNLTPANCVFGRGKIDGRTVVVVGDDFTVRGGSADASISTKPLMAEEMAHDFRLPIIRIIEGSGGGGSVKTIETKGAANLPGGIGGTRSYWYTTANMARVPVVGLGLGSVAGLGAARLAASHYSVMTKDSAMFVAGPPVVKRLGQDLSKQELGGADIQTRAGGVDHAVDTEEEAFACARRFLSYLPSSVFELPPTLPCDDDPERAEESLIKAVPRNRRQVYKMRPIIEAVVDKGSFFEMAANFGRPIIAGFARLEGRAVLLLASDPFHYGGSWTAEACQKVVRFADLAETFHLPVVDLMDCPGFMIGLDAEKAATIRHGVRAMAAVNQTTVPWCTIIVRNAFGVAGVVHQPADLFSMRYAWPSAYWGSLPLEGGIEAAYRADIEAAEDPAAKLKEIETRLNKLRSPFRSAEKFWVEEIVDPRKTRSLLCEFARLAEPLRTPGPATNMAIRP